MVVGGREPLMANMAGFLAIMSKKSLQVSVVYSFSFEKICH